MSFLIIDHIFYSQTCHLIGHYLDLKRLYTRLARLAVKGLSPREDGLRGCHKVSEYCFTSLSVKSWQSRQKEARNRDHILISHDFKGSLSCSKYRVP